MPKKEVVVSELSFDSGLTEEVEIELEIEEDKFVIRKLSTSLDSNGMFKMEWTFPIHLNYTQSANTKN